MSGGSPFAVLCGWRCKEPTHEKTVAAQPLQMCHIFAGDSSAVLHVIEGCCVFRGSMSRWFASCPGNGRTAAVRQALSDAPPAPAANESQRFCQCSRNDRLSCRAGFNVMGHSGKHRVSRDAPHSRITECSSTSYGFCIGPNLYWSEIEAVGSLSSQMCIPRLQERSKTRRIAVH